MNPSSVIVLGSVNTDLVIRGPRLPSPGETVLGGTFFQAAGGKGANQAVAAARVGRDPVAFIAAVGDDDFGRAALTGFAVENLRREFIRIVPGTPSGVALILVDARGENLISVASGANACLTTDDVRAVPDDVFARAQVFLTCLESPLDAVRCGLQRARDHGLRTILNPAPANREALTAGLLPLTDLITPNETEAELLTGIAVRDGDSARAAAARLRDAGCPITIVTLGRAGSIVIADDVATPIPAPFVDAVDTTAAGDAFNGALAVALAEKQPLLEAVRWATRAAAISVTRYGAQPSLPRRSELDAR